MVDVSVPFKISEDLAEETDWHIGDGSMNFYNNKGCKKGIYQLRGRIEDDAPHYINRVKPLFEKLYGVKLSLRKMLSTRVFGFQIWNCDLVRFKKDLGLPLGRKEEVFIPKIFFESEGLKASVVRGIFDTDGCVYLEKKNRKLYPRMKIHTLSSKLACQLLEIFKSLSFRATKHSWKDNKTLIEKRYILL